MIITKRGKYGLKPIQFTCKCGCEFNADVYEVGKCRTGQGAESELSYFEYICPECNAAVYTMANPPTTTTTVRR